MLSLVSGLRGPGRFVYVAFLLSSFAILLRLYFYALDPSIWFDEAAVMLNVLDKSYLALLGPLDHAANGPPLFLWLEKALVTALGDYPWVWRLPALTASCLSVVLFFYVARRVLPPECVPWAVGLFAFSDRLLWHTVEVRPYTIDTLVAIGAAALWLRTIGWRPANRMVLFALLCPVLLCSSYPAMFVCGGLALALGTEAWSARRAGTWLAYAAYCGAIGAVCGWLLQGPIAAQSLGMRAAGFEAGWQKEMLDWHDFRQALIWPAKALFGMLHYCLEPTGGLLGIAAGIGAWRIVRTAPNRVALVLFGPLAAVMAAGCLCRYPCGHDRPMLFLAAAMALSIGAVIPDLWRRCRQCRAADGSTPFAILQDWCARFAALVVLMLIVPALSAGLYRVAVPWPRFDCRAAAAYVLAHRGPNDLVIRDSWDQLYFYRELDPQFIGSRENRWTQTRKETRHWLTVNLAFHEVPSGPPGWKVVGQKAFGQLAVVTLDRIETAVGP